MHLDDSAKGSIRNCTFDFGLGGDSSYSAWWQEGGHLVWEGGHVFSVDAHDGAVYLSDVTADIRGVSLVANTAISGAGITAYQSTVQIQNSRFENNTAESGAAFFGSEVEVDILACIFDHNTAAGTGACHFQGSRVNFVDVVFQRSVPRAIFMQHGESLSLSMSRFTGVSLCLCASV